ncbi:magnesium transporter CorA family protein [Metabacillus sp. KIGAM252]|uniref:Magnesium transporter CorA family protein n=1 Tax=Metabacillus flavus TaxID=2823519 RepID=A0ABS5LAL1_9BACI|nr:magnesium transporter CorA family protein [Metabacillus flavus]MBS2967578.1 magnesium transporter CorA family protein [Metabacillus flavus]
MQDSREYENWKWLSLESFDDRLLETLDYKNQWKSLIQYGHENQMHVQALKLDGEVVYGSLVYSDEGEDVQKVFRYYINKDQLVTIGLDTRSLKQVNEHDLHKKLQESEQAPEGFFVLLHGLAKHYLDGIDEFEQKMEKVLKEVQRNNKSSILNKIYDLRHSLLTWKSLILKVVEVKKGIEEAFLGKTDSWVEYKRIDKQLERGMSLLKEYQEEIDTVIRLEEVISTNNGNEIMKSLTIITILFTPLTAWSALWGMNFEKMPELKWELGYPLAILIIVSTTVFIYWYMNSKGYMKDLLRRRKD